MEITATEEQSEKAYSLTVFTEVGMEMEVMEEQD